MQNSNNQHLFLRDRQGIYCSSVSLCNHTQLLRKIHITKMRGFVSVRGLALQASGRGQTNGRELDFDDQQGGEFTSYFREPLPLMSKWVKSDTSFHCPNRPRGKPTEFASGNTHSLCAIYDRIQVVVFTSIGEISRKVGW